jgi:hypothetical protein
LYPKISYLRERQLTKINILMGNDVNSKVMDGDNGYETSWSHKPNYYGQEPNGRDAYGDSTYERQHPNHWGEMPSGRDGYGNPTYG